jgi:hypothetical protein
VINRFVYKHDTLSEIVEAITNEYRGKCTEWQGCPDGRFSKVKYKKTFPPIVLYLLIRDE